MARVLSLGLRKTMRLSLGSWSWSWSWRKEEQQNEGIDRTLLYLNVYDLSPINDYLYWLGLGIFHSGIEAYGIEYGFEAHEYSFSGVFEVEPRSCPGYIFRKSILLGSIDMSHSEFRSFMQQLASEYHGDTHHLIGKNCNHFTDDICKRLTGRSIPGWINRLAWLVSLILPEPIQIAAGHQNPDHIACSEEGSESGALSASNDDEVVDDPDHHLLTTPRADVAILHEKPVLLAKDNEMAEISSA